METHKTNSNFRHYVDRYCAQRHKTVEEALQDKIVCEVEKQCIENASRVAAEYNNGWIPVGGKPPEDGTYLCTLDEKLCGTDEPFTGMCGIENGVWDEPDCVLAYQPLPEPYKPEVVNER